MGDDRELVKLSARAAWSCLLVAVVATLSAIVAAACCLLVVAFARWLGPLVGAW